jgi:hypothetical protein
MVSDTQEEMRAAARFEAESARPQPDWRALADELAAALRRQGCGFCDGTCRDCAEEKTAALARYDAARGKTR